MTHVRMMVRHFVKNDEAATMVEYGLMLALIAVVCITVVGLIGTGLRDNVFQKVVDKL